MIYGLAKTGSVIIMYRINLYLIIVKKLQFDNDGDMLMGISKYYCNYKSIV